MPLFYCLRRFRAENEKEENDGELGARPGSPATSASSASSASVAVALTATTATTVPAAAAAAAGPATTYPYEAVAAAYPARATTVLPQVRYPASWTRAGLAVAPCAMRRAAPGPPCRPPPTHQACRLRSEHAAPYPLPRDVMAGLPRRPVGCGSGG